MFKLTKEQLEKNQSRDQNMKNIMTQLEILSKNVIGAGIRSVNSMGVGCLNFIEAKFKVVYNKEVNFLANQVGGYSSNYLRTGGNQGWIRDEYWEDSGREWRDRNPTCKERDGEKDRYIPPTSIKSQMILRVVGLRICFFLFLTSLSSLNVFRNNEGRHVDP